jgi:hypothetical protein
MAVKCTISVTEIVRWGMGEYSIPMITTTPLSARSFALSDCDAI